MRRKNVVVLFLLVLVSGWGIEAHAQFSVPTSVAGVTGTQLLNQLISKPVSAAVINGSRARVPISVAGALGKLSPLGVGLQVGGMVLAWCLSDEVCLGSGQSAALQEPQAGSVPAHTATSYAAAQTWTAAGVFGSQWTRTGATDQEAMIASAQAWDAASGWTFCGSVQRTGVAPQGGTWSLSFKTTPAGQCQWSQEGSLSASYSCPSGGTLSGQQCVNAPTQYSCDPGWTLDGTNCVNPGVYPPDGKPSYRVGPNGNWMNDPLDTDNGSAAVPNGTISRTGTDPFGNPQSDQLTPTASGGVIYQQSTSITNQGATNTTTYTYNINNMGVVTAATAKTTAGGLTEVPAAGEPTSAPLELPTDYAREPTLQQVRDELSGTGFVPPSDQQVRFESAKAEAESQAVELDGDIRDGYQADKSMWFSWAWVPQMGTCSPFSGTVHGFSVSWDLCPTIEWLRDVLGWLFAVFGAWSIYNEMFKGSAYA